MSRVVVDDYTKTDAQFATFSKFAMSKCGEGTHRWIDRRSKIHKYVIDVRCHAISVLFSSFRLLHNGFAQYDGSTIELFGSNQRQKRRRTNDYHDRAWLDRVSISRWILDFFWIPMTLHNGACQRGVLTPTGSSNICRTIEPVNIVDIAFIFPIVKTFTNLCHCLLYIVKHDRTHFWQRVLTSIFQPNRLRCHSVQVHMHII